MSVQVHSMKEPDLWDGPFFHSPQETLQSLSLAATLLHFSLPHKNLSPPCAVAARCRRKTPVWRGSPSFICRPEGGEHSPTQLLQDSGYPQCSASGEVKPGSSLSISGSPAGFRENGQFAGLTETTLTQGTIVTGRKKCLF
jgi:hypothetical protein